MKNRMYLFMAVVIFSLTLYSSIPKNEQAKDWPVPSKFDKMKNPFADEKDSDQIGRELFAIHCKSCHGSKGKGDGSKAKELSTKVPDVTTEEFKTQSDGSIYYKSFIGRDDMPNFEKKIREEEDRWLLVNYLKQL